MRNGDIHGTSGNSLRNFESETRWTVRSIENVSPELNQNILQHRHFQFYLLGIDKGRSIKWVFCNGVVDNANHNLFLVEGGMRCKDLKAP